MADFSQLEIYDELEDMSLLRNKSTDSYYVHMKNTNKLIDRPSLIENACQRYDMGDRHVCGYTCPVSHYNSIKNNIKIQEYIHNHLSIKLKLKEFITVHWSFADNEKTRVYPDSMMIGESPWVTYLKTGDTSGLEDFFYACRKTGSFPEDYWYDFKLFDKLIESIKQKGYDITYGNNTDKNNDFTKDYEIKGGNGPVVVSRNGFIADGQHRMAALYYIYGPDYEVELVPYIENNKCDYTRFILKSSIPPPIKCSNGDPQTPCILPLQKTFYIYVRSGLNNKLIPLLSLLRIARKENAIIKCYWGEDAYAHATLTFFQEMFLPIERIEFISKKQFIKAFFNKNNSIYNKEASDRDRNEIIYDPTRTIEGDSVFYKIVHCISYKDDAIVGKYVPYPKVKFSSSSFIDELRDVFKDLRLHTTLDEGIQNTIDVILSKEYVVGIHLRSTDGGFTDVPKNDIIQFIDNLFIEHPNYNVYISCDTFEMEKKIRDKFGDKILFHGCVNGYVIGNTYEDKFNRFTLGTYNAACEMFLLSKCNEFYGTPGSSFSFTTWLLRDEKEMKYWCDNPWK
uniref:Uncharacterized protein n=1 Tax=viral metagenome TaxID=1070528 RepID=A0A6C0FA90_9ZZZZ|tara:strand:- start:6210 stop:7907 length:1698 start_codon:yes stop_codon:yes gene_type:complete